MEEEFKKTILVVDDEKMIRNLLNINLTKEGYNVIEAVDGLEAVELATEKKPDLILLDVMIPKLDGLSVCKRIKNMMNVPILGLIENMSYLKCPDCGKEIKVFGYSHVDEIAKEYDLKVLAKLPIDPLTATLCDSGKIEIIENDTIAAFKDIKF